MKKIVFFDGDGTLWYPASTRHSVAPQWIYSDEKIGSDYLKYMTVTPTALDTLKCLKERGIIVVVLSAHPHSSDEAIKVLKSKIDHFKISDFFESYYASEAHPDKKGKIMTKILKEKGIPKSKALMVGDSYRYDYLSARKVGIDALLIKTPYMKHPPRGPRISKTIESLKEVLNYL
jgi:FMN phosphatase YigB (HAD superfamily)